MMQWLHNFLGTVLGVDQGPDPTWKPTGYTYTFTGHDEAKGVAAVQQADRAAVQRRRIEAARGRP
jgi:hypothetical protein